jgi:putative sterol carrier protein
VPFGSGTVLAHLDSTSGEVEMALGHMEGADVTVTLDYDTAKAIFVDANLQVAMQAYMGGRIKVEGDIGNLMAAMQAITPDSEAIELAARIKAITE